MATEKPAANSGADKLIRGMKAKLDALPKVKIKIPISEQNPKDLDVTVQINGYTYQMKRGVEISVPEPVKELLANAKYI
jgi:hypothetical protein